MYPANLWNLARRGNGGFRWLLVGMLATAVAARPVPADVWVEREAFLMGTTFRAYVAARDTQHGAAAIEAAFAEVRRLDRLLSGTNDDGAIRTLNRAGVGTPVRLTPELHAILVEVRGWYELTNGAFDPGVGALTDAWDLRGAGRHPTPAQLETARAASGLARFIFDDQSRTVRRTVAASWFDAGGFGKGVALRHARRTLRSAGVTSALVNFGGQILAIGADENGHDWQVTVPHPSRRRTPIARLAVRDVSVSTTSQSERFVTLYGARFGHVLDPRTGSPVPPWGSVTVLANDPAFADVVSTALFVMGPEQGMEWLGNRTDVGVLFLVERGGRVETRMNAAMERYVVEAP